MDEQRLNGLVATRVHAELDNIYAKKFTAMFTGMELRVAAAEERAANVERDTKASLTTVEQSLTALMNRATSSLNAMSGFKAVRTDVANIQMEIERIKQATTEQINRDVEAAKIEAADGSARVIQSVADLRTEVNAWLVSLSRDFTDRINRAG